MLLVRLLAAGFFVWFGFYFRLQSAQPSVKKTGEGEERERNKAEQCHVAYSPLLSLCLLVFAKCEWWATHAAINTRAENKWPLMVLDEGEEGEVKVEVGSRWFRRCWNAAALTH